MDDSIGLLVKGDQNQGANAGEPKEELTLDMDEFDTLDEKITSGESNEAEEQRFAVLAPTYA